MAPRTVDVGPCTTSERAAIEGIAEAAGLRLQLEGKLGVPSFEVLVARAEPQQTVVGFALLQVAADELELLDMAVHPDWRRQGVGRQLISALVEFARSRALHAIFLEVRQSNLAAEKLYRSAGFDALSVRRDYYAAPREDAIVMSLSLAASQSTRPNPARDQQTVPLLRRESFGALYHVLTFDAPQAIAVEPGQFAMVRGAEWGDAPLLPRPMSYLTGGTRPSILIKVVGEGTMRMARAEPGEPFTLLGPLGHRWRAPHPERRPVLVAGGVGVAPLLFLARELHAKGVTPITLYGGRSYRDLPLHDELAAVSDLRLATEDGSRGSKGRAPELLQELLRTPIDVFTCGPDRMMAAVADLCAKADVPCEASLETPMACGYGVCLGCPVLTTGGEYIYACTQGPCIDAKRIDWRGGEHAPVRKSVIPGGS